MFFELSQLPQAMQEHILNNNNSMVQIVNNGQVIKNVQFNEPINKGCYFDIEQMQYMMDSEVHQFPKFKNDEEFLSWVNS